MFHDHDYGRQRPEQRLLLAVAALGSVGHAGRSRGVPVDSGAAAAATVAVKTVVRQRQRQRRTRKGGALQGLHLELRRPRNCEEVGSHLRKRRLAGWW